MIDCGRYRAAFNGAPITPVFPPGITHSAIAASPDSTVVISYVSDSLSAAAKHVFCPTFKTAEQVFVIWSKHHESRQAVHKNEPLSVELGLLDPQRVLAKFCHDTHPRRLYVVPEFAFSLASPLWLNVAKTRTSARYVMALQ